jgi:hypothetical protein
MIKRIRPLVTAVAMLSLLSVVLGGCSKKQEDDHKNDTPEMQLMRKDKKGD